MKLATWFAAAAAFAAIAAPVAAQTAPPVPLAPMEAPTEPNAIPLYPDLKPGKATEQWTRFFGQPVARNVSRPTLTPFLPSPDKATGAAVIVAPGGGFKILSMENEGWAVARWLADQGVAAFVLKYRLNPTARDEATLGKEVMAMFAAVAANGGKLPAIEEPRATQDALAALALVRSNATKWAIDPDRVGMIGFSAGAITTLNAVLEGPAAGRPAYFGYIYGPMAAITPPADAPPMFAALTADDDLFGKDGFGIVEAWRNAGRPVELHYYEKGGHGFGLGKPGTTTPLLMEQFHAWLGARGLLAAK